MAHPAFANSLLAREPAVDYATVFRLAEHGDACARALRDHSLAVGSALAVSLIHAYDPTRLILGEAVLGAKVASRLDLGPGDRGVGEA
jgi:hypothetical protein